MTVEFLWRTDPKRERKSWLSAMYRPGNERRKVTFVGVIDIGWYSDLIRQESDLYNTVYTVNNIVF